MAESLPIQCSVHHASPSLGSFSDRCALTDEQRKRIPDYGSEDTVPREYESESGRVNFCTPIVAEMSRAVVDLNRAPDSETLFSERDFAKNRIWKPGQELTDEERAMVIREVYEVFHGRILSTIRGFDRPGIVIAWDNTSHREIENNSTGEKEMMMPFILSNRGTRGSVDMTDETELQKRNEVIRVTTCDPQFLSEFAIELRRALKKLGLPDEVGFNVVYKGDHIAEHYNTRRHPAELSVPQSVESLQVEYDTIFTHDPKTLEPNLQGIKNIRLAFEQALYKTYTNLLTHNVYV